MSLGLITVYCLPIAVMEGQPNQSENYIHGYTSEEQRRLIEQAFYWRDKRIGIAVTKNGF
jgi:hypothetical protein